MTQTCFICWSGAKQYLFPSNTSTTLEVPRALSLLSSTSWGSYQPESISLDNPLPANQTTSLEPLMHAIPQGMLMPSSEYLQPEHSTDFSGHTLAANSTSSIHLSQVQLFKVPHDTDFYFNIWNIFSPHFPPLKLTVKLLSKTFWTVPKLGWKKKTKNSLGSLLLSVVYIAEWNYSLPWCSALFIFISTFGENSNFNLLIVNEVYVV